MAPAAGRAGDLEAAPATLPAGLAAITARWFEAATCGAMVVGRQPEGPELRRLFPYCGFVREVDPSDPADSERVVILALSDASDGGDCLAFGEHVREAHTSSRQWRELVEICDA